MNAEIEVIRTKTIEPSSPTPDHLRHYQLSFTDVTSSALVIPIILCYPSRNQCTNSEIFNHLQKSLSKALTLYYPLGGRIVENSYINCDDSGVPLVESRVHCELSQVIKDSEVGEIVNKFLPSGWDIPSDLPLVIQANFFNCGGMAIGLGFSHKVGDVPSLMMFIHSLAAIARGDSNLPSPNLDSANLFPPANVPAGDGGGSGEKLDIVTKRFIFSPSSIAALKHKYSDNTNIADNPTLATKVEVVSIFSWSRLMASAHAEAEPGKTFLLADALDLRPVADPPLPDYIFGNLGWISMTTASGKDLEGEGWDLVRKMREAATEVNAGIVSKLKESDFDVFKEAYEKFSDPSTVTCSTSSFCGFNLYEADFGWGKPIWLASATFQARNAVILMDSSRPDGDGVEVWFNLTKEDMAKFEVDKEFLSFASPPCSTDVQISH